MYVNKSKTIGQLKAAITNILLETCENVMKNTIEGSKNCGLLFCLKVIDNGDHIVQNFLTFFLSYFNHSKRFNNVHRQWSLW